MPTNKITSSVCKVAALQQAEAGLPSPLHGECQKSWCACDCHQKQGKFPTAKQMKDEMTTKSHTKAHQMAVYIDVTKAYSNDKFQERALRLTVGSLNLPNTMKSDVYLVADKVLDQVEPTKPFKFPQIAEGDLNEQAAAEHAASMGYVGFMILRPTSNN